MKKKPNNSAAYTISIILITLFFGCTVEQTHKTLVFFFDGVDQVIFYNDYLSHDSLGRIAAAKREALLKKNRPDMCVHKPYKEKKCEECHTPDKRLLMPMPDLCFKCHTSFVKSYAVVHGPVAAGACLNCHNQHSSKYPKLLIRQGQQICVYCHNPSLVFASKVHKDIEDAECTMCHNPHGGKSRYMLKDNISKDANRIGLMDELTYRHLYGQLLCKVPGDVNNVPEIHILDDKGNTVSIVHPDANGKFNITNLHPDQNYTFRFKKDVPDCKINVYNNNGSLLYVIQKNKKGNYSFDKNAYETVHTAINDAHYLGDTTVLHTDVINEIQGAETTLKDTAGPLLLSGPKQIADSIGHPANIPVNQDPVPTEKRGKIIVTTLPDNDDTKDVNKISKDTVAQKVEEHAENKVTDTIGYKGRIVVKELPGDVPLQELIDSNKAKADKNGGIVTDNISPDSTISQGKVVAKAWSADQKPNDGNNKQSKIVVTTLPDTVELPAMSRFKTMAGAQEVVHKLEASGMKLTDLTSQLANYFDGTSVCVFNGSGDLIDVASVNAQGEFYLYDFLYFRLSLPDKRSGIINQTIYINEKMEVIETINKRMANGHYVYIANSKEQAANRAVVKIYSDRENAVLFSSVYFDEGRATITKDGVKAMDKVVEYLQATPSANIYLLAHANSMGSSGFNRQLAEKRSDAAVNYLTSKGIKLNRIKIKGNKKNKVIGTFETTLGSAEENQKNRRVDVYIKL